MGPRHEIRETLRLGLPIAFAQVAVMTMRLVAAGMVGRVSATDFAGGAMGESLVFAAVCPAMGVTMAVEPLASQAMGAGEPRRAWLSLRAGLYACLLLTIPTMLLALASTLLLDLLRVDPAAIPATRRFVLARLLGMPLWLIYMAAKAYLEARGKTRPLLQGGWMMNVVNVVVAWLLVFGDRGLVWLKLPAVGLPALGSLGAGLSITIGNGGLAAYALWAAWLDRPEGARLLRGFAGEADPVRAETRKLLRVGLPMGWQLVAEVGVFSLMSLLAGRLGARVSAAHQIAIGLASYTFMGVLGLSGATAVRVGRAVGAGEARGPRRAGLTGVGLAMLYACGTAALFVLAARPLARLFTGDVGVIAAAVPLIYVAAAMQLADGIQGVAAGALRGAADTRFALWANVVCHWGLGLPVALLLGFQLAWGAAGLWWGLTVGLCAAATVLVARFWRILGRHIQAV